MVTPIYSDEQLLKLLEKDIEKGAAALMEQYSGILWSVCARRLQDPEDIKECVNGSFADFCLHYEKYDPEKGSLRTYLCGIADLKALEAYRKIASRLRAREAYEQTYADAYALPTESSELEAALEQLEPEDAKIIRMKYYEGMTYLEIAKALGLNPETVKKRGQRSLKKLKFILIGLIIALVLAGCAYIVHRYFRFAEGFGVFTDADTPVYQLSYASDPLTVNGATFYIQNATYRDGELNVKVGYITDDSYTVTYVDEYTGETLTADMGHYLMNIYHFGLICTNPETGTVTVQHGDFTSGAYDSLIARASAEAVPGEDGSIQLEMNILISDERLESARKNPAPLGAVTAFLSREFDKQTLTFQLTLTETEAAESLDAFGSVENIGGTTLLVRPGATEDGWVKVPFYPLVTPEGMGLSPLLCAYYVKCPGYEDISQSEIFLEGTDGTQYPLIRTEDPRVPGSNEYQLWFRDVPAGEYTLKIPRVCYAGEDHTSIGLSLPLEDGESVACDKSVTFAAGGTLHIRGVSLQKGQSETGLAFQNLELEGFPLVTLDDMQDDFVYTLDYEIQGGEGKYPLIGMAMDAGYYHWVGDALIGFSATPFISDDPVHDYPFGTLSMHTYSQLHMPAPDVMYLTVQNPIYMDEQAYSFPVTVR